MNLMGFLLRHFKRHQPHTHPTHKYDCITVSEQVRTSICSSGSERRGGEPRPGSGLGVQSESRMSVEAERPPGPIREAGTKQQDVTKKVLSQGWLKSMSGLPAQQWHRGMEREHPGAQKSAAKSPSS